MLSEPKAGVDILRMYGGKWLAEKDVVAREAEVAVILNGHELVRLTATPEHLSELALGYLYCNGILDCIDRVESLEVDEPHCRVYVATSESDILNNCPANYHGDHPGDCFGITSVWDIDPVDPNDLLDLMRRFEKSCHLFHETGGSHAAAISDGKGIILLREDVGRYNAIDKVVGYYLLNHVRTSDKILFTSARASSEIVSKAYRLGSPILASPSAPTDKAVKLAYELGLTLIGFARAGRLNIYSGFDRVKHSLGTAVSSHSRKFRKIED